MSNQEYNVGFIDLGPAEFSVKLRGKVHPVYGLSALSVFDLLRTYPELEPLLRGQRLQNMTPEKLMQLGPQVGLTIGAMGLLERSRFEVVKDWQAAVNHGIKQIAGLGIAEQFDLLDTVIQATMPQGRDVFIERLNQMKARLNPGPQETSELSTNSHESSFASKPPVADGTPGPRPLDT